MAASRRAGDDRLPAEDALRIALSPTQLAAVLEGETAGREGEFSDRPTRAAPHPDASVPLPRGMAPVPDFPVPLASAGFAGAIRVAAVRAGRIVLMKHEVISGTRAGSRKTHCPIGLTGAMLGKRANDPEAGSGTTPSMSTFTDLLTAERALSQALRIKKAALAHWISAAPRDRIFTVDFDLGRTIGRGPLQDGAFGPMTRVKVRLRKETYSGSPHYIVTAEPSA